MYPSTNYNFKSVCQSFPYFSHIALVAMANPAPLSRIVVVLTPLYSIDNVVFPSSPSQYSPTLLRGTGLALFLGLSEFPFSHSNVSIGFLTPIFSRHWPTSFHIWGFTLRSSAIIKVNLMGVDKSCKP